MNPPGSPRGEGWRHHQLESPQIKQGSLGAVVGNGIGRVEWLRGVEFNPGASWGAIIR